MEHVGPCMRSGECSQPMAAGTVLSIHEQHGKPVEAHVGLARPSSLALGRALLDIVEVVRPVLMHTEEDSVEWKALRGRKSVRNCPGRRRRFWFLSIMRAHTKAPSKIGVRWKTLRVLNHPMWARTVRKLAEHHHAEGAVKG